MNFNPAPRARRRLCAALFLALGSAVVPAVSAATLYSQDFDAIVSGADGWYSFSGPANLTATFAVTSGAGVGGSSALVFTANGAATFGTDWYWYAGIGRSDIATSLGAPASAVTFSLSLAAVGATSSTPVEVRVAQFDGSTETWSALWTPSLTATLANFVFTLDTGTQTGVYSSARGLSISSISFNNGGFGLDDGNQVIIDNVNLDVVSAIPEPSAWALLAGLLILPMAFLHRRKN